MLEMVIAEFLGAATVALLLSMLVSFILQKLSFQQRPAYWISGVIIGLITSIGKLRGLAYDMAKTVFGDTEIGKQKAIDATTYLGMNAEICKSVLPMDLIIQYVIGTVIFLIVYFVYSHYSKNGSYKKYFETGILFSTTSLMVWGVSAFFGLLVATGVGLLFLITGLVYFHKNKLVSDIAPSENLNSDLFEKPEQLLIKNRSISTPIASVPSTSAPTSTVNQSLSPSQPIQATFEDSYGAAYPNYPVNSPKAMPSPASAPASNINQPSPPSQPLKTSFVTSVTTASTASDDLWAQALTEYDSSSRNQGLWARLFSEAQGNEALVKANYMRIRVDEMQQVIAIEKERVESAQKVAAAEAKEAELLEVMNAEQRAYDALPKGLCPNCWSTILSIDANHCPKCLAYFGRASKLKIKPLSKSEQIAELRDISLNGGKLTEYEEELLKRGQ